MNTNQIARLRITRHAKAVMRDRCVSAEDLFETLRHPHITEPHEGRRRFVRNDLVVVIAGDDDAPVLVTVLWRRREQWTSEDMRSR